MSDQTNLSPGDKEIKCRNCPSTFIFTKGEQEFYATRQLSAPVRCKACRDARKAQNTVQSVPINPMPERNFAPSIPNQGASFKKSAKKSDYDYGQDVEVVRKRKPEKRNRSRNDDYDY